MQYCRSKIYALIGSTEESLLLKNPKFQENLESVGSLQEGLQRLRDEDNGAVLVTDAAVADHAVGQVRILDSFYNFGLLQILSAAKSRCCSRIEANLSLNFQVVLHV